MVPRIVLSMGAATVESVGDPKHASKDLEDYDYIVFREERDKARLPHLVHCVDVAWVKDCLISGRLHRLPSEEV